MPTETPEDALPPPQMLGVEGAAFHPVSAAALRESASMLPFDAPGVADAMPTGSLVMPSLCGITLSHKRRVHRPATLSRAEREARRKEQRCRFVHFGIDVDADDTPAALLAHYYGPTMGVPIIRVRSEAGPWAHNYNAGAIDEDDLRANDDATECGDGDTDDALSTLSGMTARSSGGSSHGGADADDEDGANWLLSDDEDDEDGIDAAAWARARRHLAYPSRHGGNLTEEQMTVAMRADAAGRLAERHFEAAQNEAAEAKLNEREVSRQRVLQRLSEVRASKRAAAKAQTRTRDAPLSDSAVDAAAAATDGRNSPSPPNRPRPQQEQQSSMPASRAPSASATPLPEPVPLVLAAPLPKLETTRSATSTPLPLDQREVATPDARQRASRQESMSAEPSPTPCRSCPSPEPAPLCDMALVGPGGCSRDDERSPPTPQPAGSTYASGAGSPMAAPSPPPGTTDPPGLPPQEENRGLAAAELVGGQHATNGAARRRRLVLSADDVEALDKHFEARVKAHCARNRSAGQPAGGIVLCLLDPSSRQEPPPDAVPAAASSAGPSPAASGLVSAAATPAASAVVSRRPSRMASAAATPAATPPVSPAVEPAVRTHEDPILPTLAAAGPLPDAAVYDTPAGRGVGGATTNGAAAPTSAVHGPEVAAASPAASTSAAAAAPAANDDDALPAAGPGPPQIKQDDGGCCIVA